MAEEQGHAVASVLEQRMGIADFRFDEGGLAARSILQDFASSGSEVTFDLNIGGSVASFATSADAINNAIDTQFSSARLLSDRQLGGREFSSSNNSNQYKVQAGDTFWDLAKADLGGNASEAEIQARTQQYLAANDGVDPLGLQVGQAVTIPGLIGSDTVSTLAQLEERSLNPFAIIGEEFPKWASEAGSQIASDLSKASTALTENYDNLLGAWDLGKEKLRNDLDAAAIADGGGAITVAASIITGAQEIGFGLIDAGLGLGGIIASETVRQGHMNRIDSAIDDFKTVSPLIIDEIGNDLFSGEDDFRVTAEEKFTNNKAKVVVGTDFKGLQFKNFTNDKDGYVGKYGTDEVARVGTDWEGNDVSSIILEKSTRDKQFKLSKPLEKLGFGVEASMGARYNMTSNQARTAINLKLMTPFGKMGFEWRGAEHSFKNGE